MVKILVVDDEESVRKSLRRLLTSMGHEMVEGVSGNDALTKLDQGPFDVLLTDNDMENMNGRELLTRLEIEYIPIKILMSGRFKENRKEPGYWKIYKPIDDEVLEQIITGTYQVAPKPEEPGAKEQGSESYADFLGGISKRSPQEILAAAERDDASIRDMLSGFRKGR